MTTFLVHDAAGTAVSVGTVLADPMPDGLSAVALTADEVSGLLARSHRWDSASRSVIAVDGWVDPAIAEANGSTIRTQAVTALTANRTFLALGTPTNAQTLAQVRALTRQMNGLIRLNIGALNGTD